MINITTACNENYAPGLHVAVASALHFLNHDFDVKLFLLDGGLSKNSLNKLEKICNTLHPKCTLTIISINEALFEGANLGPGNSYIAYARLKLGSLIPVDRVIYFDVDMLIMSDLAEVWNLDMKGCTILAVLDGMRKLGDDCPILLRQEEKEIGYFNSGFMVIDLKKMRSLNLEEKMINMALNYLCILFDQTVLNYFFRNDRILVDEKYNYQSYHILSNHEIKKKNIHFTDKLKPWFYYGSTLKYKLWRLFYSKFVGSPTKLFLKNGITPILLGYKELCIRRISTLKKLYFSYLGMRWERNGVNLQGLKDFYGSEAMQVDRDIEIKALSKFEADFLPMHNFSLSD